MNENIGRQPNHKCKACGVMYYACNDCDTKKFISWRAAACCPEHYQVYITLFDYDKGDIDKATARERLEEFGVGEWVDAPSQKLIDEIFAPEVEKKVTNKKQDTALKG